MLRIYLAVVVVTAVVAIGSVLFTTSRVENKSQLATEQADAAVTTSQISLALRDSVAVMFVTAYSFVLSGELDGLPPQARDLIIENFQVQAQNREEPVRNLAVPVTTIPITRADALELQTGVGNVSHEIDYLLMHAVKGVDLRPVIEERDRLVTALGIYLEDNSSTAFRDTFTSVVTLGTRLNETSDAYTKALTQTQNELSGATQLARYTMIAALLCLLVVMVFATVYVSKLIQRAFRSSETERLELLATTETLQYRNDQLNALYNVFAEITDTLSTQHVISATLRETLRVMRASVVAIRLLKDGQLIEAGTLSSSGRAVPQLPPVALGEGPVGRVARRGRGMRIDARAQDLIGPQADPDNPDGPLQSGIVVPLIVGSRVVGTLACWSYRPYAFHEQDERILEMMASQVATAVITANTQESLERRALYDPLTNLPNRHHLDQDLPLFERWRREGKQAVVAMMDIDHFKQLNDAFGHRVGDFTLREVAAVMRKAIRESDRIYRYGGEEFVVIFEDAGREEAHALAERVVMAVAETAVLASDLEPAQTVTISAGLALMPEHGDDIMDLLGLADRAMYRAKESGRNRIEIWDENVPKSLEHVA